MTSDVLQELSAFGAVGADTLLLDRESYRVADYLDLIWRLGPGTIEPDVPRPTAVVEADGRPVLYVVAADALSTDSRSGEAGLMRLRNLIACRGDGAHVAVLRPGQLTIYRQGFSSGLSAKEEFFATHEASRFVVRDLCAGVVPPSLRQAADRRALHDLLFDLIVGVSKDLRRAKPLRNDDDAVLSLVGRALFARFLVDRHILTVETLPDVFDLAGSPICFADPAAAARTCRWMDETFNGDLLPLPARHYESYFASLKTRDHLVFRSLSKIVARTEYSGQQVLDWGWINFAHVPVGILSEVYEDYAHEFFSRSAEQESIRYTPRHIAEFMTNDAFEGLPEAERHKARVLDPAAGGGVFLVLALRRLFVEHWKKFDKRPTSRDLHAILLKQICGFDINRHALRLAAFSLHLTTIELEPTPSSPKDLRFVKLDGIRLLSARKRTEPFPKYPVLGSLGDAIGPEHDGQYDILISNPPWTAWKGKDSARINAHAEALTRRIAAGRLTEGASKLLKAYRNPDNVPDLPFVWRCMQWARPGGVIALALHSRLIFKRSKPGIMARDLLFRSLRVTGILNGGGLDSSIWPGMNQPFCLLFARNTVPGPNDVFRFVSAEWDEALNNLGFMRVDPDTAEPIHYEAQASKPYLLKTLFRGTMLDADLIERLNERTVSVHGDLRALRKLRHYWTPRSGLYLGVGYQVANGTQSTAKIRRLGAKDLTSADDLGYLIDARHLKDFDHRRLNRPRKPELYKTPLVIVTTAIGETAERIRARLALGKTPIAFAETFFGCSTHGHPDAADMARYLFLLLNSDLYVYYVLMTSSKFGVERRAAQTTDIKEFPIPPFESLTPEDQATIRTLTNGIDSDPEATLRKLNNWVFALYGLTRSDRQLVHDALATQMPYTDVQRRAVTSPGPKDVERFRQELENRLQPYFHQTGEQITVRPVETKSASWRFLSISTAGGTASVPSMDNLPTIVESLAAKHGCSRVFIEAGQGHLLLGILSQFRYWTPTRARLCSLHILRNFSGLFPIPTDRPA